ncbi:response regulator [Christensenellaceae bacterium OttesenSCG-928-K19]|nr:response regulator [Christensenellaceae bacterium OttesenSCG-928-K19]
MEKNPTCFGANISGLSADAISFLADSANVGIWNWHLPSDEMRINRSIAQITGYELGEVPHRGSTRIAMIYDEDVDMVQQNVDALTRGEIDRYDIEFRMVRRDGSIVWVTENAIIYEWDEQGVPIRLAGIAFELSRLKQAEQKARDMEMEVKRMNSLSSEQDFAEQNRLLRAGNSAAALLVGDFYHDYETVLNLSLQVLGESVQADRAFIWRNRATEQGEACFYRSEWTCDGSSVFSAGKEDKLMYYDEFFPSWQEVMAENHYTCAQTESLPDGLRQAPGIAGSQALMLVPLYLHGVYWGGIGFAASKSNTTFTNLEAEIMNASGLLIASSISRNETFGKLNKAREEALASTKAKSEFLSRMSHEIRTPMNAIIGMTTLAHKTDDLPKIKDYLGMVDASSRQLLAIINDVLDMSKIDANKFEIMNDAFDFEKMLQNVFNVVQVKLEEKNQQLFFETNQPFRQMIISDELRLSQVLINLLNNAIKFTPENGKITLKIQQDSDCDEGKVRIHAEVIDTGIGIDEDAQKKLFQSFEQADGSITRQYGGTGLGLAICKKIIDLMGGQIWVESQPGKGTKFLFDVTAELGNELPEVATTADTKDLHVLVVDDQRDVLEYFQKILAGFSVRCDVAQSGREAVSLVQKSVESDDAYDMVFIDWNMPGMRGGETAKEIKRIAGNNIIAVMISVSDWDDIEKEAKEYGVTNFLAKPVLPSTLFNTIAELAHYDFGQTAEPTPTAPEDVDWSDKRILLVEDIKVNRVVVEGMLKGTGIAIDSAENGQQAIDIFQKDGDKYDLILMDVQMPVLDGLEATRRIRLLGTDKAESIPIIAMTANAFKEDEQICLEAGMNKHIAKPFSIEGLFSVISEYIGRTKSR